MSTTTTYTTSTTTTSQVVEMATTSNTATTATAATSTTGGAVRRRSSAVSLPSPATVPPELAELDSSSEEFIIAPPPSTSTPRSKSHKKSGATYAQVPFSTIKEKEGGSESTDDENKIHPEDGDTFEDEPTLPQSQPMSSSSSRSCADYYRVMKQYPMFRSYFISHVCQHLGDWFVRIASILVVEQMSSSESNGGQQGSGEGKTLSHLVLSVLLPKAIFSQVGGIISDKFDRRNSMIVIDCLSGIVVLGYLIAIHMNSLNMIFVVSAIRSSLSAMYYPITTGIVPLLVHDNINDLQLAVTLNSWAWGCMAIFGGIVAGFLTAIIGLSTCYIIDCITFMLSAIVIYIGIKGNFKVNANIPTIMATTTANHEHGEIVTTTIDNKNPLKQIYDVFYQTFGYLWICGFGLLVFSKPSASLIWGIEDIVGAEFSTVFDSETGLEDEELSSWHMGLLFSVVGAGCTTGPAIVNIITDPSKPYTLQRACLIGLCFLTGGWLSISQIGDNFHWFLFCTFFRTMGSGTVWVNSTVLLQALTDKHILGRVLAVEYTLTTLLEACSATISGKLNDDAGYTKNQLALFGAFLGIGCISFWSVYYLLEKGAAHPRFNYYIQAPTTSSSMTTTQQANIVDDIKNSMKTSEHGDVATMAVKHQQQHQRRRKSGRKRIGGGSFEMTMTHRPTQIIDDVDDDDLSL